MVSELMQKVAETFGIKMPTALLHRKVMATTPHTNKAIPEAKMRALLFEQTYVTLGVN